MVNDSTDSTNPTSSFPKIFRRYLLLRYRPPNPKPRDQVARSNFNTPKTKSGKVKKLRFMISATLTKNSLWMIPTRGFVSEVVVVGLVLIECKNRRGGKKREIKYGTCHLCIMDQGFILERTPLGYQT